MNKQDIRTEFDKWWDANEEQFMADSCHMSEYHMAMVVWLAALEASQRLREMKPE